MLCSCEYYRYVKASDKVSKAAFLIYAYQKQGMDDKKLDTASFIAKKIMVKYKDIKYLEGVEAQLIIYYLRDQPDEALKFLESLDNDYLTPPYTNTYISNNFKANYALKQGDTLSSKIYYSKMKTEMEEYLESKPHDEGDKLNLYKIRYMIEDKENVRKEVDSLYKNDLMNEYNRNKFILHFDMIDAQQVQFFIEAKHFNKSTT